MTILFEFTHKSFQYRGVKDANGYCRMEKKKLTSKKFRPYMWTGSELSLEKQKEIVVLYGR